MKWIRWVASVVLALLVGLAASGASAQTGPCVDLCRIPCVKPISFADRWDDATGIPGYMGELVGTRRSPDWRNNVRYDFEAFTDANANGLHDAGETYTDANANGAYDAEAYDPGSTGYTATGDLGLVLSLHPADATAAPTPGQFLSIMLPPVDKGTPDPSSAGYREAWAQCEPTPVEPGDRLNLFPGGMIGPTNQAMRDLIASDFNASWDDATKSVIGSEYPLSPRVFFVPVHDPRIPSTSGTPKLVVRKIVAFFGEQMTGSAILRGRLLRVQFEGETCGGTSAGGFVVMCPVPAPAASWGRVKATYR